MVTETKDELSIIVEHLRSEEVDISFLERFLLAYIMLIIISIVPMIVHNTENLLFIIFFGSIVISLTVASILQFDTKMILNVSYENKSAFIADLSEQLMQFKYSIHDNNEMSLTLIQKNKFSKKTVFVAFNGNFALISCSKGLKSIIEKKVSSVRVVENSVPPHNKTFKQIKFELFAKTYLSVISVGIFLVIITNNTAIFVFSLIFGVFFSFLFTYLSFWIRYKSLTFPYTIDDEAFLLSVRRILANYQFVELTKKSMDSDQFTFFDGAKRQKVKVFFSQETHITCPPSLKKTFESKFSDGQMTSSSTFSNNYHTSLESYSPRLKKEITTRANLTRAIKGLPIEVASQSFSKKCTICLKIIGVTEKFLSCPFCGVVGHVNHFNDWLKVKNSCPNCRKKLV